MTPSADDLLHGLGDRVRASGWHVPTDAEEAAALSMTAMLRDAGLQPQPDRPVADVKLSGHGVHGHEVSVADAVGILGPLQNVMSAIGQALRGPTTLQGKIASEIRQATQLRLSPQLSPGSVVFHLTGAGERVTGDELPNVTGSDTLLDMVMVRLSELAHQASIEDMELEALARRLRPLGARTAKHLNDLVSELVDSEINMDMRWRVPSGHALTARLHRDGAFSLREAISRNAEDVRTVTLIGTLETVSTVRDLDLVTETGARIVLRIPEDTDPDDLRQYFHRTVEVTAEQTTVWNLGQGSEKRSYRMLDIRSLN